MLGGSLGVAQQILALQSKAFVSHCHAHYLSLRVNGMVKNYKQLSDTMGPARKLVIVIKYSPKQETIFDGAKDNIKEENSNKDRHAGIRILKLCPTRCHITEMHIPKLRFAS